MLTHESEQFLNSVLVQHESLHVCKNCTEPEILEINRISKVQSYGKISIF